MKKQSGFTLIELLVAMAVLGLIMGGNGTFVRQQCYQSACRRQAGSRFMKRRVLLMNELKTTLRYADKDSIDPEQPTVSTSKFSYKR